MDKDFICIQGTSALIRKKTLQLFLNSFNVSSMPVGMVQSGAKYSSNIQLFSISFFPFEQWEGLFSLAACFKSTVPFAMLLLILILTEIIPMEVLLKLGIFKMKNKIWSQVSNMLCRKLCKRIKVALIFRWQKRL